MLLSSAVYENYPSTTTSGSIQTAPAITFKPASRPNRPNTLNVPIIIQPSQALDTILINTPSNGTFNFDSLMEGRTGLTPINNPLKALPDIMRNSMDLNTPITDASKLCSL